MLHMIVDGANVVGSVPDGWWKDRAGAARRLAVRLTAALADHPVALFTALGAPSTPASAVQVHLVLEGAARAVEEVPTHPLLAVVLAPADGDAAVVALTVELAGAGADVIVVTADRMLRERVRAAGAATVGPSVLLRALSRLVPIAAPAPDRGTIRE